MLLGLSGPGGNDNEDVLCIPQSSSITGASPPDCLASYPGHSFGKSLMLAVGVFPQTQPTGLYIYIVRIVFPVFTRVMNDFV